MIETKKLHKPVPHQLVLSHHVPPQEAEVVAPSRLEEGVAPEQVAKSDGNERHVGTMNRHFSIVKKTFITLTRNSWLKEFNFS